MGVDITLKISDKNIVIHYYMTAYLLQLVACLARCSGVLQVRFPDLAHYFTNCQLLVKR